MSGKTYYEQDADPKLIEGKRIAVLGYGSQGRAHALNLKDSGHDVIVGLYEGSKTMDQAKSDGVAVATTAEAVKGADIIVILAPDPVHPAIYREAIVPVLKPGLTLVAGHGFNVHYGLITPPDDVDVILIAPKSPGNLVRELFKEGRGVPMLLGVHQDATGKAKEIGLAYAHAIGGTRAGVFETSFREETETDLFGEQAVICGGLASLMKTGFETLVEAGYAPEMAYFECVNEMKLIVDLVYRGGLAMMREFISSTAKYGDITRGPRVIDDHVRENMKKVLEQIQNGEFAREWVLENQADLPVYKALLKREAEHPVEEVGQRLRGMMKWLI